MNANLLLSDETTFRLASTMLHFLWQGAILGSLAWGILHVLAIGRARVRYAIYFGLLLVLAMAPIATFVALSANVRQTLAPIPARKLSVVSADRGSSPSGIAEASSVAKRNTSSTLTPWVNRYQSWLVAFWVAGVFVLGVRLIVSAAGTWIITRGRQPPSQEIIVVVGRLTRSMAFRVQPSVYLVDQISQALAVGIWKPMILLPAAWALELSPTMLEAVLAHELAHLRRWDLPINLLQRIVETCLFFHPVVWWCSRRMRIERELCCDELAIQATGNRLRYAEALTYLAEQQHASSQPLLAAGIGGTSMVLLERIRNVLGMSIRSRGRFYGVSCALVGAAAASAVWLLFLPGAGTQAEPSANRPLASSGPASGANALRPSVPTTDNSSVPTHEPMLSAEERAAKRPVLKYVQFLGNKRIKARMLAKQTGLKKGDPLDAAAIRKAADKITAFYESKGFKVNVEVADGLEPNSQGAVFLIREDQKNRFIPATSQRSGAKWASGEAFPNRTPWPMRSRPASTAADLPSEKNMVALPPYIIEPPDILFIQVKNLAPRLPYRIRPADQLRVEREEPSKEASKHDVRSYAVDSSGRITLGSGEASLDVQGLTEVEAAEAIHKSKPGSRASVKVTQAAALQPITGEHLISPDGTVNLGTYGLVRLAGKTVEEARSAVEAHLSKTLDKPQIFLSVFTYNSKVFYVIKETQNSEDEVARFPATGNETVLDVLGEVDVLSKGDKLSERNIWIARPQGSSAGDDVIVPVNFEQIAQRGHPELNYQVFPGDRIFIRETTAPRPTAPSDTVRPEPPPVYAE